MQLNYTINPLFLFVFYENNYRHHCYGVNMIVYTCISQILKNIEHLKLDIFYIDLVCR